MNWDFVIGYALGLIIGATALRSLIDSWKEGDS